MFKFKFYFFIIIITLLTGCVSPIPLNEQSPAPEYKPADKLLISVIDERKRVSEGKPDNFIGVAHAAFGIPVDWSISQALSVEKGDKERNLSEFLTYRIINGLKSKGWNAEAIIMDNRIDTDKAAEVLKQNKANKLLILNIHEWYFSINLNWVSEFNFDTDTLIQVYQIKNGKILEKQIAGRDVIIEKADDSPQNSILRAYRDQLQEIFSDPDIQSALIKNKI
ncbi:hypothetical protein [Endozoicomonas sp. Mp262]|uniref:hypothetical protein n=1 Tax=Endozoicomonas sp. Mp262 TaxID=2919499 RepID=UPI0021D90D91